MKDYDSKNAANEETPAERTWRLPKTLYKERSRFCSDFRMLTRSASLSPKKRRCTLEFSSDSETDGEWVEEALERYKGISEDAWKKAFHVRRRVQNLEKDVHSKSASTKGSNINKLRGHGNTLWEMKGLLAYRGSDNTIQTRKYFKQGVPSIRSFTPPPGGIDEATRQHCDHDHQYDGSSSSETETPRRALTRRKREVRYFSRMYFEGLTTERKLKRRKCSDV